MNNCSTSRYVPPNPRRCGNCGRFRTGDQVMVFRGFGLDYLCLACLPRLEATWEVETERNCPLTHSQGQMTWNIGRTRARLRENKRRRTMKSKHRKGTAA
jgi:hypothetical protein